VISERVLNQPAWLNAVVRECHQAWERGQKDSPNELAEVEKEIEISQQVQRRLADAIENGNDDITELTTRLRRRQSELRELQRRRTRLQSANMAAAEPPTRVWIEGELRKLHKTLLENDFAAFNSLRQLIGGTIVVTETSTPGRKRKHFVGTFELSTRNALASLKGVQSQDESGPPAHSERITIEFRSEPPWAKIADIAKEKFDAGVEFKRIALELDCSRSWIAKALAWWHAQRGLPAIDGRKLRARIRRPKLAERPSEQAKALWDAGLPMQEIARRLNCHRDAVTAAIRHWFESRGSPMPDGRTRRKELRLRRRDSENMPMD